MLKAVFFDLGHTLTKEVDTSKKVNALLKLYNLNWKKFYSCWRNLYFLRSVGAIPNDREMFVLLKKILRQKNIPCKEIRNIIIFESHIIPEENINVVKEIKKEYKIGLITNFVYEWLEEIFKTKKKKIKDLFDVVLVSSKIGMRKPNAEIFYLALKQLSVEPNKAVFVSDDLSSDLICAKGCGIRTIWLNKKSENKKDRKLKEIVELFPPDAVIKDLKEIIPIIKNL